jgi:hypothetical protein
MGFRKPDITGVRNAIGKVLGEIHSPYNDGYVQSACKHDLYMLKCWLDTEYSKLPTFAGEEQWEQDQIVQILKQ